jgi:hypothetical protein
MTPLISTPRRSLSARPYDSLPADEERIGEPQAEGARLLLS